MSNATQSVAAARIDSLLDANSFVEIGQAVTARATDFNMTEKKAPSDGVITGYGVIDGSLVYVYSQDASVLNGTVGEMHAKKIAKIYDLALKVGAPVIGLVDCAGLRLQEATDALEAFGEIYLKQTLASGVIPQITAVFGTCGGGMAVVPALTDFHICRGEEGQTVCKHSKCTGRKQSGKNAIQLPHSSRVRRQELLTASEQKRRSLDRSVHWSACFRITMKTMTASRSAQMT